MNFWILKFFTTFWFFWTVAKTRIEGHSCPCLLMGPLGETHYLKFSMKDVTAHKGPPILYTLKYLLVLFICGPRKGYGLN